MTIKKGNDSNQQQNGPDDIQPEVPTRRKVLKSLAVGSTVIGGVVTGPKWVKPVIDKVVVPAHAQTSPLSGTKTFTENGTFDIPNGVTKIDVTVNGAGGGGGAGVKVQKEYKTLDKKEHPPCPDMKLKHYSGGSGQQVTGSYTVTSGSSYKVTIGYGGQGTNTNPGEVNEGGAGCSAGYAGHENQYHDQGKKWCWEKINGGGGGSSCFKSLEASGGGGGGLPHDDDHDHADYTSAYTSDSGNGGGGDHDPNVGKGGGPDGGYVNEDADNGQGASGGGYGNNGANGSVVINYS